MTTKTHTYGSYKLVLDSSEIYPSDPGNGTPAMVYCGKRSGTYGCVSDTGVLDDDLEVPAKVMEWLHRMAEAVDIFIETHSK
jgi:hypothetical protein